MTSDPLYSPEPQDLSQFSSNPVDWRSDEEKPLDSIDVEDEVLAAVEEGKEDAESSTQTKAEAEAETKDEAPEEDSKVSLREQKNQQLRGNPIFVASLRKADGPDEKTCGHCLTRKPLGDFARGKTSNFCIDCEGK